MILRAFRYLRRVRDTRDLLFRHFRTLTEGVESITAPADAASCARIANDEMAALVAAHPDRFIGACACLPMTDVDAALAEAERAIDTLGFLGVEIFTDIAGKPLDSPEFLPIFARMAEYDLPILLHPRRTNTTIDYAGEAKSKFLVYTNFGWPFEIVHGHGAAGFRRRDGSLPRSEDHHASRWRARAVLSQTDRAVVGLQRAVDGLRARRRAR